MAGANREWSLNFVLFAPDVWIKLCSILDLSLVVAVMPPFIPPSNPPALIKSIAPETINATDRSIFLAGRGAQIGSAKIPLYSVPKPLFSRTSLRPLKLTRSLSHKRVSNEENETTKILKRSDRNLSTSATVKAKATSEVVNFYQDYSVPNSPPLASKTAATLGKSIFIGSRPPAATTTFKSKTKKFVSSVAIAGLDRITLSHDSEAKFLVTRQRGGKVREFQLTATPAPNENRKPENRRQPDTENANVVEVIADRQEYNTNEEIITATGNVEIRFSNGVLVAERVQVNLRNRLAVAEGEVVLTRGEQILRGDRFEYNFVQDSGAIISANGEIYQPSTSNDFDTSAPVNSSSEFIADRTLSDRLALNQPLQRVTTAEGYSFSIGRTNLSNPVAPQTQGGAGINRIRFQADRVDFDAERWTATNVRLTNDPFSPPELELRAASATYRNIAPLVDEVILDNSRIVFDQSFSLPTFQDRIVLDRRRRSPGLFTIGYDGTDRGGLYIERGFKIIDTDSVSFDLKPQYLLQRVIFPDTFRSDDDIEEDIDPFSLSALGLIADLDVTLAQRTTFRALGSFASLDPNNMAENLRVRVGLRQLIGEIERPHSLSLEYKYRERIYNGSLGFQTVNNNFGLLLASPDIPLGDTGINLSYQAAIEQIEASTDRPDLLEAGQTDDLISLTRYQGSASLNRGFLLWQGDALPPTAEEGLRYTPTPVQPYLKLVTGITGATSVYSNGDSQPLLTANVGILGQLGHFSEDFFDYTGFNLAYSQSLRGDESPFLFDRFVDAQTLSWGITQQIYGPIRVGVQSSFNLDNSDTISTDFFVEYSRRTYNILLRYNPVLEIGSISLRISDFNWSGNPGSLDGTDIRPVQRGITR
jgi:lipopolysaccharide export system protein LptA